MSELSEQQIAWCGGVIDAIGHVRTRETDAGSLLASVSVSTAQLPIAERLAHLTGIGVTRVTRDYNRVGCSDHCTEPHLHVVSVTARWNLTGARALIFLNAVRPYLVFKAAEADDVIRATGEAPAKPATAMKMATLGWPTEAMIGGVQ